MSAHKRSLRSLPIAIVLLAVAAAGSVPSMADLVVTGRVVDHASQTPLQHAQVYVSGTSVGVLTDRDGRYRLLVPTEGAVQGAALHVVAEIIGYGRQETALGPQDIAADSVRLDFSLEQQALSLHEMVVGSSVAGDRIAPTVQRAEARPVESGVRLSSPTTLIARTDQASRDRAGRGEQYARISENGFRRVRDHPLSTFSSDVDRASYSNIRRFLLRERRLPPVDAVQVEEMVNYFSYDYTMPEGRDPVGITTELGAAPWNPEHRLMRIGLATRPLVTEEMPANNLVFLIDVSGSMQSADKLPLVKRSLRLLVDQLRAEDRVAIAVYAGSAGLVLESTSGRHKDRILEAIDRLEAGGSTAGGAGLRLAYRVARDNFRRRGNNRVILATDGDFNVGESSDAAMVRLIEDKREEGTFLTVLGFGTGNLQSEKMQSLAQHGNGNYAYIDRLAEARKVFVNEMGGTLVTVAKDVKIQVEFNPAHVAAYRLIGYENRLLANEDFDDDTKDAGDVGAGHTVTALYEIIPAGSGASMDIPGVEPLRYQASPDPVGASAEGEVAFVRVRYKRPNGFRSRLVEQPVALEQTRLSSDFHFASAVAAFGMLLRESEHRGSVTASQVRALASDGLGEDTDGYRKGFLELVDAYRGLTMHADRVR